MFWLAIMFVRLMWWMVVACIWLCWAVIALPVIVIATMTHNQRVARSWSRSLSWGLLRLF